MNHIDWHTVLDIVQRLTHGSWPAIVLLAVGMYIYRLKPTAKPRKRKT